MNVLILLLSLTFAQAQSSTVEKGKFLEHMKSGLPNMLCAEESYFRKCFDISKRDCEKQAQKETKTCLNKLEKEIPKVINQPDEGSRWGASLGSCTGLALEKVFKNQRKNTPTCNDPSKWMGK
ncbi:MAG: hypothetical protein K2Q26_10645 [Bdellovibrionales bacterium]|nr:hypothetical protein [Bdellovibrionales bacterium]